MREREGGREREGVSERESNNKVMLCLLLVFLSVQPNSCCVLVSHVMQYNSTQHGIGL